MRQWFRTAEPLGERRYENWNTHTSFIILGLSGVFLSDFTEIADNFYANMVEPDQMLHSAVSNLDLHCLPMSFLWVARHYWGKQCSR